MELEPQAGLRRQSNAFFDNVKFWLNQSRVRARRSVPQFAFSLELPDGLARKRFHQRIARNEGQIFDFALRGEHPVKRIAMRGLV